MNKLLKYKLETLIEFQQKHPNSHVGGSIGLMLRGINLRRVLTSSDLDITTNEYTPSETDGLDPRSDGNDFDYALQRIHPNGWHTKIDIRINPEPSFDVITFEGSEYNVSKLRDILFWKKKYADKGVQKHIDDLITIETGVRPIAKAEIDLRDDLPW